jgi:hypothetical protein
MTLFGLTALSLGLLQLLPDSPPGPPDLSLPMNTGILVMMELNFYHFQKPVPSSR